MTPSELAERYANGQRDFQDARLAGAQLSGLTLEGAVLNSANLSGANLERANLRKTQLMGADLRDAVLDHADLTGATLFNADLSKARLGLATLAGTSFRGARLAGANLQQVNAHYGDFMSADLTRSVFMFADLEWANFTGAVLTEADFSYANLGATHLIDVNLVAFCNMSVVHHVRSHVDYSAIVRSVGTPGLKPFLLATGMPDIFVEYMVDCARSLKPMEIFSLLQSTFISYGSPDEAFARKLNGALEAAGVTTFFFKDDALPGERLDKMMRTGVRDHDRVILICSEASLNRKGLLNELVETVAREARDGGNEYLIPVRLDDSVFDWKPARDDLAQAVRDRVIADFSDHHDPARFREELSKLIRALKKPPKTTIVHT